MLRVHVKCDDARLGLLLLLLRLLLLLLLGELVSAVHPSQPRCAVTGGNIHYVPRVGWPSLAFDDRWVVAHKTIPVCEGC